MDSDDVLTRDLAMLQGALDAAWPNWFEETAREYTDAQGRLTASVCVPVRAAIKLIEERERT